MKDKVGQDIVLGAKVAICVQGRQATVRPARVIRLDVPNGEVGLITESRSRRTVTRMNTEVIVYASPQAPSCKQQTRDVRQLVGA